MSDCASAGDGPQRGPRWRTRTRADAAPAPARPIGATGLRLLPPRLVGRRGPHLSGLAGAVTLHGVALALLLVASGLHEVVPPSTPPGELMAMLFLPAPSARQAAQPGPPGSPPGTGEPAPAPSPGAGPPG